MDRSMKKSLIRTVRMATSKLAFFALIFGLVAEGTTAGAADEKQTMRSKIQEFEERLKSLEMSRLASQEEKSFAKHHAETEKAMEIEELRRQLGVLAEEVEKLRSGESEIEVTFDQARALGLSPSAASTYRKSTGVSIAGYGEMVYQNFDAVNGRGDAIEKSSQLDFLRAVIYTGYRFNDKFVFNSEIELEHANEASVEFAYLDYRASPHLTLRGGLLLVPMGITNEFHEPTVLLGTLRPQTERRIIPTTWRENGFGVLGSTGMFNYRVYLINGLDAGGFSSDGLRGGRQKGSNAKASDLAFVGRLDVSPTPGVFFGGSVYTGNSGQNQFEQNGTDVKVRTVIGELHAQVQVRGFDVRGLYARATLDDVAELNAARSLIGQDSIGESLQGGYVQFGYNVLSQYTERIGLTPYYRFERLNTQDEVPPGFFGNPIRNGIFHSLGLELRPIYNIVLKSDYQWTRNEANTGLNQYNIALGYAF